MYKQINLNEFEVKNGKSFKDEYYVYSNNIVTKTEINTKIFNSQNGIEVLTLNQLAVRICLNKKNINDYKIYKINIPDNAIVLFSHDFLYTNEIKIIVEYSFYEFIKNEDMIIKLLYGCPGIIELIPNPTNEHKLIFKNKILIFLRLNSKNITNYEYFVDNIKNYIDKKIYDEICKEYQNIINYNINSQKTKQNYNIL